MSVVAQTAPRLSVVPASAVVGAVVVVGAFAGALLFRTRSFPFSDAFVGGRAIALSRRGLATVFVNVSSIDVGRTRGFPFANTFLGGLAIAVSRRLVATVLIDVVSDNFFRRTIRGALT